MHLFIGKLRSWQLCRRPVDHNTILRLAEPIIVFQIFQVSSCEVYGHNCGNLEEIFGVKASSALCSDKFGPAVVFALKLLLMQHKKLHVPDVIKYDGVMVATPKLHHLGRKHFRVPHLEPKRVLEKTFCILCLSRRRCTLQNEEWIPEKVRCEVGQPGGHSRYFRKWLIQRSFTTTSNSTCSSCASFHALQASKLRFRACTPSRAAKM